MIDLETCEGAELEEELVVKEVKYWEEWLEQQLLDTQGCHVPKISLFSARTF